jgi:hypothetical protein
MTENAKPRGGGSRGFPIWFAFSDGETKTTVIPTASSTQEKSAPRYTCCACCRLRNAARNDAVGKPPTRGAALDAIEEAAL